MRKQVNILFSLLLMVSATGCSGIAQSEGFNIKNVESQTTMEDKKLDNNSIPNPENGPPDGPRPENIKHESVTFTGKVSDFVTNPDKAYDAFNLDVNGSQKRIKFPPHMAKKVMDLAKAGSTVTVDGELHTNPENISEIHFRKLTSGSNELVDQKPGFKLPDILQSTTDTEGTVKEFKKGPKGDTNGLILSNNTIINLPPKESTELLQAVKTGDTVKVTGYLKSDEEGFVYSEPVKIIKAVSLTLNNKVYDIKKP